MVVRNQVGLGLPVRILCSQDIAYYGIVVEIHTEDPHIAVLVELQEVTLGEFVAVFHHRGTRHILVTRSLDRHITDRSASQDGEITLPYGARILEREMEMPSEVDDLRIFLKYIRKYPGRPISGGADGPNAVGLAEQAAVDGIVYHRMRDHDDILVRLCSSDGGKSFIKPLNGLGVVNDRRGPVRCNRQYVIVPHLAVPAFVADTHLLVQVEEKIIVSQGAAHISSLADHR